VHLKVCPIWFSSRCALFFKERVEGESIEGLSPMLFLRSYTKLGEQKDADAVRSTALCLFVAGTLISQKVDFPGDALTAHK
jgi:hypothetical protein